MSMQVVPKTAEQAGELSVSEVTRRIRGQLEGAPELRNLWVRGELSDVKLAGSGHLYFTLKDAGSQLRTAYWNFSRGGRKAPEAGRSVLVHGEIRVYEQRGEYQLIADDLIAAGAGDLAAAFEALKRKLHAEGLFEPELKVPLPQVPHGIGVVTSTSTAALRDVLHVLARRAPYARVVVFHCSVQGAAAPAEIIATLGRADACPGVEVILLVRGGGSAEDLACFNDEALARALAQVRLPVITGIGHEIDYTIPDFIADHRAPTPSAAAELAAADASELAAAVGQLAGKSARAVGRRIETQRAELARLFDRRLLRDIAGSVDGRRQALDDAALRLVDATVARTHGAGPRGEAQARWYEQLLARAHDALVRRLAAGEHAALRQRDDLLRASSRRLDELASRVRGAELKLGVLNPRAPLQLGYALVRDAEGRLVRDPQQVAANEELEVEVQRGRFGVRRT